VWRDRESVLLAADLLWRTYCTVSAQEKKAPIERANGLRQRSRAEHSKVLTLPVSQHFQLACLALGPEPERNFLESQTNIALGNSPRTGT
jgi:hypothetical protein